MKIRCSNCNAAYAVDDSKVEGKKFGFECPKCGENVVIDNRKKTSGSPAKEKSSAAQENAPVFSPEPGLGDLPSFDDISMPGEESLSETVGDLPSFDEEFNGSVGKPAEESAAFSGSADSGVNYEDYEDEIEPEIDLSVLQKTGEEEETSSEENDILSSDFSTPLIEEDLSVGLSEGVETISEPQEEEDESITIDLGSLDIELAEPEEIETSAKEDDEFTPVAGMDSLPLPEELDIDDAQKSFVPVDEKADLIEEEEDESITLDLDSLDIALEENDEIHPSESLSDESRLSLDDAGLTLDDLSAQEPEAEIEEDDEKLRISLDEVGEGFSIDDELAAEPASDIISDNEAGFPEASLADEYSPDKLPEVDLERFGAAPVSDHEMIPAAPVEDQYLDIESGKRSGRNESESVAFETVKVAASGGGYIICSVDYAFHYSRLRALLRLVGIYYITFIPHFIVGGLYSLIAAATSAINWLLILFTGAKEKDFSMIQEQSVRYALSIYSSLLNVTEDKPSFAGKKNVDYQLQFEVVYPPKYSRVLAFLRLTGIGIFIAVLPHMILLSVLSVGMSLIAFVSLLFTLCAGHWPSVTFDFMVRYLRYCANIAGFVFGLVDTYPSFRFE